MASAESLFRSLGSGLSIKYWCCSGWHQAVNRGDNSMTKELWPGLRATLVLALYTGIIFPLLITAIAQVFFPGPANGSLVTNSTGTVVGSSIIGQSFTRPEYFHPRPS